MNSTFYVSFPGLGIEDLKIDRVAFSLFGMEVYWYGMLISLAVILCLFLARGKAKKHGIDPDAIVDSVILTVPMMLVFARIYYVLFALDEFKDDPLKIFNLRTGGLAFYGGVIGGILAILIISKVKKIKISSILDILAVYLPLGHGIGRWGNFFNQEAFGTNTDLPWGMISEGTSSYLQRTGYGDPSMPVHPTFMYEFLGNMVIFAALWVIRDKSKRPYETTVMYIVLYGLLRFFVEAIRTDALYIGNTSLRISMVLSGAMFLIGLAVFFLIRKRPARPVTNEMDNGQPPHA